MADFLTPPLFGAPLVIYAMVSRAKMVRCPTLPCLMPIQVEFLDETYPTKTRGMELP